MHFEGRLCQQNSRIPGPPFSFENTSFSSLKLCRAMQFIIFLCRCQVWNCVGRCNFMKFHAFLCRFQVWNCIDRCNVSHVYAILKCETLSFDVIWKNIILLWVIMGSCCTLGSTIKVQYEEWVCGFFAENTSWSCIFPQTIHFEAAGRFRLFLLCRVSTDI